MTRKTVSRQCKNPTCGSTFESTKSLYCSSSCKIAGAHEVRKLTNMMKFGVENPFSSPEIQAKISHTMHVRYGVSNPMQDSSINAKAHVTMKQRYGTLHALQSKPVLHKMQETMTLKYGAKSSLECDELKDRIYTTQHDKYGNSKFTISHITPDNYVLLNTKSWLEEQNKTKSVNEIMTILGVGQSVVNRKFREFGIVPTQFKFSKFELSVQQFLSDNNIHYIVHDRTILAGKELDIYLPEYNMAIECNGSYWHSEKNGKTREYHLDKLERCKLRKIQLLHIWEHEWLYKLPIIISGLLHKFGKVSKIYARKCLINAVSQQDEEKFLNINHLDGYCTSTHCIGLYHENILVSLMSFKQNCGSDKSILLRFASINNSAVTGAASKLFKFYLSNYSTDEITTYSRRDKFSGGVYKHLGFCFIKQSSPTYYYTHDYVKFSNKTKYRKHQLAVLLPIFDNSLTEWDNMKSNGYDRIWDCGNDIWKYKRTIV